MRTNEAWQTGRKTLVTALAAGFAIMTAGAAWAASGTGGSLTVEAVKKSGQAFAQQLIDDAPNSGGYCGTTYMSVCVPAFCASFGDQPGMAESCVKAAVEHLAKAAPSASPQKNEAAAKSTVIAVKH